MSDKTRSVLISCSVLLGVICLCLSLISVVAAGIILSDLGEQIQLPFLTTPHYVEQKPEEIEQQMNEIQEQVISLRGLQPVESVPRTLLTPEDLRQRITDEFINEYTPQEAQDDTIILSAFGLLEQGFDMYNLYLELYSEQVAGYYDNESKEMFVVKGEGFEGPERMTYAHEYNHVLQDQNYDFQNGLDYNDESCKEDTERCAAIQALVEGDSTLLELSWFTEYSTPDDQQQIMDFYSSLDSPIYDSAPAFLKEDFIFAYLYGQKFVQVLFDQGGWPSVDQAYRNLPVSTEQIMHPERYPKDQPIQMELPDLTGTLGEDWRELDRNVMGEWYTYLILARGLDLDAQLDDERAFSAVEGWGGDTYTVYYNEQTDQTVMVITWLWESNLEADEFETAFKAYADARFDVAGVLEGNQWIWEPAGAYSSLIRDAEQTIWVLAPDASLGQTLQESIQSP